MKQLKLEMPTHGGKRAGAGRKRRHRKPTMPHRSREPMSRRAPLHVTMRVAPHVYDLRSQRCLRVVEGCLRAGAAKLGVLVVQVSVQGNHLHFLVEADDTSALGSAMKGLAIRLARGLNRVMRRRHGQVFAERYHSRVLGSPTEVRQVIRYLRGNRRHHLGARAALLPASFVDPYTSDDLLAGVLPVPTLWLLRVGWRRGRAR
jgi:REP element-mobilizing transposase RayT